jgi:gamma-glutamyltranspeptidase/glutathione hydrolase
VVDKAGNAVAVTYTLNTNFGSGIVATGTGITLNNEMDDFSAKPGVPAYGLVGGDANAVQAGKRPLSSMTPTFVLKDGKPWLVTGSPGGHASSPCCSRSSTASTSA